MKIFTTSIEHNTSISIYIITFVEKENCGTLNINNKFELKDRYILMSTCISKGIFQKTNFFLNIYIEELSKICNLISTPIN